eukprot:scaffold61_cov205-Alexandrium_tamarense.AAC.3
MNDSRRPLRPQGYRKADKQRHTNKEAAGNEGLECFSPLIIQARAKKHRGGGKGLLMLDTIRI